MKRLYVYILGILIFINMYSFSSDIIWDWQQPLTAQPAFSPDSIDNRFAGWEEEDYKVLEDSIRRVLYPVVEEKKLENTTLLAEPVRPDKLLASPRANINVPTTVTVDKSKAVGQIPVHSGNTPGGGKSYTVPIQIYPGMNGFEPELALAYNSQQSNGVVGVGWAISGMSTISRSGKSVYYDGKSQGILMTTDDAFTLNGVRLIKTGGSLTTIDYQSEQSNIKVKAFVSGAAIKYFEAYYPNGAKGVFGYTSNSSNTLFYPLTSFSDLKNNKITYTYSLESNRYRLLSVAYNGASVEFQYQSTRPDPVLVFSGGVKITEPYLLQKVITKFGTTVLGTYDLTYSTQNFSSHLAQIGYTSAGKSFNPVRFYYGTGVSGTAYTKSDVQLTEWHASDNLKRVKLVKGKFNYDSGADGLISVPNQNPYWKHYRHSTAFRHSQNRFDNYYASTEKIFIYEDLNQLKVTPVPNVTTEANFIDIFCANLEGKQEEQIIKVNNGVSGANDQVIFHVYKSGPNGGISKKYTRTFNFNTVYTDADGGKSIMPKFYYTGDFNGDGKMEVLAVSCHEPFGSSTSVSICYLFDLEGNKILYDRHMFPHIVNFVGTQQSDAKVAYNNTDKLFVFDYDGDGKTDICHINDTGTDIYTFDVSGSLLIPRKVSTYTGLKKAGLVDRDLVLGEINGDGFVDILVSPAGALTDYTWSVYNSMGNGQFEKSTFTGARKNTADFNGFLMQDVNGDGMSDLVSYSVSGFTSYLAKKNNVGSSTPSNSMTFAPQSVIIPTNMNSYNCFSQLVSMKDGKVSKFSFPRNDGKEMLMTGMANSFGVIEKNEYQLTNEEGIESGTYIKGYNATYPFLNINEPIAVLAASELYLNGKWLEGSSFMYQNAILHRQGLGFRGFEKITSYNNKGQRLVQTYEPFRYCVLKSEESPEYRRTYNFAVDLQANKTLKIRLTSKTAEDLLKSTSVSTSYVYDAYGNPTQENNTYTGGITVNKVNSYSNNTNETGYLLGFLTDQTVSVTRNGSTYTERMYIPEHTNGYPATKISYINGNQVKKETYLYDSYGNRTKETSLLYSSSNTHATSYTYDGYGRLTKVTNPLNLTNEFVYDATGRVTSKKDHKNATTSYIYDAFGRESSVTHPDRSVQSTLYNWSSDGATGLYSIEHARTGGLTAHVYYDAFNREVRNTDVRFNGVMLSTDKLYDNYGNLQKVSQPFPGSTATLWSTYAYDIYDRPTSITEPSGRITTHSYSGNSVTTVEDKISTTRTCDAQANLLSVTDPAGTITYNLRPDGQPLSIVAPGNVTTSFGYDPMGRRISLTDPSYGVTSYTYDASGNILKETDADNRVISYSYDVYNRVSTVTTPEFVTTYSYNAHDELTGESTNNGTSKTFTYDDIGRLSTWKESVIDNKWLQKEFTYVGRNVSSIKYSSQSGVLTTENYTYANGYLSEIKLSDQTSIYKLSKENDLGLPSEIVTGNTTRNYDYDAYGFPTGRRSKTASSTFQNFGCTFDVTTSNLTSRKDNGRNLNESFGYDNLNRLTSYSGKTASFDVKGNVTQKSDAGTFAYTRADKPYAISEATVSGNNIPARLQSVTYNSFKRPNTISENGYAAAFTYNGQYDRVKMNLTKSGARQLTRYYLGGCYELDETSTGSKKEKLYLAGDFYDASTVYVKEDSGSGQLYSIYRDYLGSITHITNSSGTVVQELSYDAWGRLRNPSNQVVYAPDQEPVLFLGRGYTGHEHLPLFGLVNMNARLYDPVLGRFLSPDPYVQAPDFSQNFNRYAYAMNNPLRYVDEDGEVIHIIVGGIVVGWINLVYKSANGQVNSFTDGLMAFGIGAAAGAIGAATGGIAFAAAGGAAGGIGGFLAGAAAGGAGSAVSIPVQSGGNALYFGDPFVSPKDYALGVLGSTVTGGIGNGTIAAIKGNNFWTGKDVMSGRGLFSFNNTPKTPAPEMKALEAPALKNSTPSTINKQSSLAPINSTATSSTSNSPVNGPNTRFVASPDGVIVDVQPTVDRIKAGLKLSQFKHDGWSFKNDQGLLPVRPAGYYNEYGVPTPGLTIRPGAMRIVTGGNKMWFTPDHYETFIIIKY